MPRSTVCPQCDAQLILRDETDRGGWVQCANCRAVFELDSAALRPLAEAMPVEGPPPKDEAVKGDEAAGRPTAVTLADLMPPSEAPRVAAVERREPAVGRETGGSHDQRRPSLRDGAQSVPARPHSPDALAQSSDYLPDELAEPMPAAEPSLSTSGWSAGADRLEELLARVDREAAAAPGDVPSGDVAGGPTSRPRRKRSPLRTLVGITLGGVVGLAAGYYLLLVVGGPEADALELARYVPPSLLPAAFQVEPVGVAAAPTPPADKPAVAAPQPKETAEIPASFVAPAEPSKQTMDEERYTAGQAARSVAPSETPPAESGPAEPQPFDESAALPLAATEPHVTGAPSYTIDQLRSALDAARQAKAGLVDGDLNDPAARRTKGTSYTRFCELAEVLTYVEAEQSAQLQREAEQLVAEALADPRSRAEVARIAAIWLTSPNRRSGGVLLAGAVIGRSTLGQVDECQFDTGQGTRLTILVPARSAEVLDSADRQVAVIGTIVEAPGEHVSGYTGIAPRAVWVRSVLPLP